MSAPAAGEAIGEAIAPPIGPSSSTEAPLKPSPTYKRATKSKARTARSPPKANPIPWDSRPAPRGPKTDEEEVADLMKMLTSPTRAQQESKHEMSQASQASSLGNRPAWDKRPLRNPPGALRGVRPVTQEPWGEVQAEDLKTKLDYGHEFEYEYNDGRNHLVEEARRRREENRSGKTWTNAPVKHVPPTLRGQQHRRAEPWSHSNDDISFLNAIDGVSVNEFYAVTADRDNRVAPTIVQPSWDDSRKLGRPSTRPGMPGRNADLLAERQFRAAHFRAARAPGAPEGGPALNPGTSSPPRRRSPTKALRAKTER